MKKLLFITAAILCIVMMFAIVACDKSGEVPPIEADSNRPVYDNASTLVVYFSQPDNVDDSTVVIGGETLGNTQYMAYVIQDNSGANIFRIVPSNPYPTNHGELVDLAREEQRNNARPEFDGSIENFDSYDTVFVGYPIWWSDMPMIMYTFFDTYDFSGKTIIPFNTHGGSGFAGTVGTIKSLEPDAEVIDGLSISRNHIQDAEQEIADWVKGLGFENPEEGGNNNTDRNVLIAYFSWSGTTTRLAQYVKEQLPTAELYEIERQTPYSDNYNEVAYGEAKDEADNNARPPIKNPLPSEDISKYDTIIIMYPIWWHTAPMVVGTFFESYDLSGVDIYPITQSASMSVSQFNQSFAFIESCAEKNGRTPILHEGLGTKDTAAINAYLREQGII